MDALWSVEDKLNISTPKAIIALVCTIILVISFCTYTVVKVIKKIRKNNQIACHDNNTDSSSDGEVEEDESLISKHGGLLKGGGCWSRRASTWDSVDEIMMSNKCYWLKFSGSKLKPPVWQRPILMGEKCELPSFSGLILYDENGRPLPHHSTTNCHAHHSYTQAEDAEVARRMLLKDLL